MTETLVVPRLADVVESQRDLDALCHDRPQRTDELFAPNEFYGHASVLKTYARTTGPVRAVIPHGPYLDAPAVWREEIEVRLPAVLSYPAYRDDVYASATRKVVVPSSSPYVYAVRLLEDQPEPERDGLIFFLSHATHHLGEETPTGLADVLAAVDRDRFRVTVCVYWKDYLHGRHLPFAEKGLKVVSAGHMFDPLFLLRLHHLCSMHEYSSGNSFGSHLFFSVHSGCTYRHLPGVELPARSPQEGALTRESNVVRVARPPSADLAPDIRASFMTEPADPQMQRRAADYFLRTDRALGRRELAGLLASVRRLDRFGVDSAGETRFPPTAAQRIVRRIVRKAAPVRRRSG